MQTRGAPRIKVDLKIVSQIDRELYQQFSLASGNAFDVKSLDISEMGMGILSQYFLPKGLILELDIDGKPFGLDRNIRAKSEVRFCKFIKNSGYKCGIKFVDISDSDRKAIAAFVVAYEKREFPRVKLSD